MFQLSLRSLLLAITLVALAIVSLRFASVEWRAVIITIVLLALCGALIVALIDRDRKQAFAIGFVVAMLLYGACLLVISWTGSGNEFNPDRGSLPTTWLLRPIFFAVAEVGPIDIRSGERIQNNAGAASVGTEYISMGESPSRRVFMTIGHAWWAILFGLCGGWFAQWIYLRRQRTAS